MLYSVVWCVAGGRGLIGSVKALSGSVVVRRRVKVSVRGLNRSVVIRRGVGGFRKGSKKRSGVLREGVVGIGV